MGRMVQQGQKVPAEGRRWRQSNLVCLVEAQGTGGKLIRSRHPGSGYEKLDPVDDSTGVATRERTRSPEARNGLHAVHRHGALLVPGDAQAGGGEVAGSLCGQQGHLPAGTGSDAGNGPGSPDQTRGTSTRRCPPAALQELRLDQRRSECFHTDVALLRVEPEREEGVSGEDPSARPHQDSGDLGGVGALPSSAGSSTEVSGHEGHHPGDPGRGHTVPDHDRDPHGGRSESLRWISPAVGEWRYENPRARLRPERGQRQPLAKQVEQAYKSTSYCEWTQCQSRTWKYTAVALTEVQRWMSPLLSLPQIKLRNPHNACYFNSCIQAFFWFGALVGDDRDTSGATKAGIAVLKQKISLYLPDSLAWRHVFACWANISRQQDAAEFFQHLVQQSMSAAYSGRWESRLSNPIQVSEAGTLQSALLLQLEGPNLQTLVRKWRDQYAIHALVSHAGIVVAQLCRYQDAPRKDRSIVALPPGARVTLPIFESEGSTNVKEETFRLAWVVFHLGDTVTSGHYQTALSVPLANSWEYRICDGNRAPRKSRKEDRQVIDSNGYLIGLLHDV